MNTQQQTQPTLTGRPTGATETDRLNRAAVNHPSRRASDAAPPASPLDLVKRIVQDRQDLIAEIEAHAQQEVLAIQERARLNVQAVREELGAIGKLVDDRRPGHRGSSSNEIGKIKISRRAAVLATLPASRQAILAAFPKVRPGLLDNTISALIKQGKVARVGVGMYARNRAGSEA